MSEHEVSQTPWNRDQVEQASSETGPAQTARANGSERAGGKPAVTAKAIATLGFGVALVIFLLDQASKNYLLYGLGFIDYRPGDQIVVTPFFNIVMAWNYGVSFGMFQMSTFWGTALLVLFALAMCAGLSIWLLKAGTRFLAVGLGMIIGGALGNLVDRVLYGAVADFFDFHVWGFHWYIFNIADVGIVCGVGILLLDSVLDGRDSKKVEHADEPEKSPAH